MASWFDDSPESRHILVWMIVAAAAFEFILQAVFAFQDGRTFVGAGWTFGAVAISTLAYFIESVKAAVGE